MHPQRWQQIEEIFQAALDLAPGDREPYITNACAGDESLKHEVEALLTQYEAAGNFIDEPVYKEHGLQALAALMKEEDVDPLLGRLLGAYRIEREIGRGGMGTVYEAVRADNVFRRRVAAKVVKRGMDTDFILRRFRNERQILADLDHPNIARLLDGGTTDDGLPFFIMEFIEGEPVYRYCDAQHLSIRERLDLFRRIADAVHYAHQSAVIHRDIKPSNILVSRDGVPKLLDFGIAKLLNPELAADTIDPTLTSMRLMTPEYASPEQINGENASPASDIYSLGVLLYELLTGHRPYRLKNRALHEIARVVSEEEPEPLSSAVTRADGLVSTGLEAYATLAFVYQARRADVETLRRELAGDLERIVMKALRKEPSERYKTARELCEDITRYLEGHPVSAPPYFPSANRSRPATTSFSQEGTRPEGISFAVLPFKLIGAPRADDTGDEYLGVGLADGLITRLSSVHRFIVRPTSSVLRYSKEDDPLVAGQELGVDFIVDGNIRRAGDTLRVTAQLLCVTESATRWAGQFDEKIADVLQLEDSISEQVARALVPQLSGDEHEQLKKRGTDNAEAFEAYLRGRYHWNLLTEENFAKAINCYQRAVTLDPGYAAAYAAIAEYYGWLAVFSIYPPAECLAAARDAARRAVELDGTLAEAYTALGFALLGHVTQWETAGVYFRRAIELNPNYPMAHVWYGCQLTMEGRFREADAELERACELDPLNPFNAYNRQWCLYQAGRFEESIKQGYALLRSNANYSPAYFTLSWALRRTGAFDEALDAAKRALKLGGETPLNLAARGAAYAEAGREDKARRVLAQLERMSPQRFVTPYHRALIHLHLGERERALELLDESVTSGEPWVVWLGVEPQFESLRADPRFIELLRRTNNPAAPNFVVREPSADQEGVKEMVAAGAHAATSTPTAGDKVVAVLPLKILTRSGADTTGDNYLGIGLADALITRLSGIRSLRMRPTSSVLRYTSADTDPLAAGRELNVDYVVDGHLRRVGDRIRVTAQLLNVREGAMRWAAQFDEHAADVLQLEDSISEQLAGALVPHLSGAEQHQFKKRGTDNAKAFEAYLRGRYYWNTFTEEGFAKALICYNQAVAHAPDYALAYAGIADYYNWLGVYAVMPFRETSAAAKEAALKAVALDETLAEAYSALGFATLMHDFDWEQAERHLSRAVELNPNYVMGRLWYSYFLGMAGRFDESLLQVRRALELDPLTPIVHHAVSWTYYYARRFEEATEAVRKLTREEPRYGLGIVILCMMLFHAKQFEEAIEAGRKAVEMLGRTPYTLSWLASAYAAADRREECDALLQEIEQMAGARYVSPYLLAMVYCNLGEEERAFAELEHALLIRDARLVWLGVDPQFDRLRHDTRFTRLLKETNNPAVTGYAGPEATVLRVREEKN